MRAWWLSLVSILFAGSGCVMVNPGNVRVGGPAPIEVGSPKPSEPMTAYGPTLQKVIAQQDKVLKALRKGKWSKVADEASEWTEYVRTLNGYAGTSHDPEQFHSYCEQLLVHTQAARDAAVREDAVRCEQAIRACDPILNRFSRDFPISAVAPPVTKPPKPTASKTPPRVP
ncbi:MAG TPA: hypothetical protein PKG54_00410 [Phycisphaerae bacterium]|jgi:hypothetical protein|nr:hypothetical protein [Phycisphaerae bacterium]HOB72961.1 hypothetical protein [Phycisphaerae bacterium]HOJ52990.1 hypothetical protein [Phycisphaerae bacterium]HOL24727.1 hypothetical protein [Phycisphaerae bacterium]HPP19263.1 hypothetical protein [Phycisphaerae bacterium]